jgi:anhydro-N-acetylmuramic acid kinase
MRVAGLMSVTSLDGIDVAVVDLAQAGAAWCISQPERTPAGAPRILAVSNAVTHTREIARLNVLLGELYAAAVLDCGVPTCLHRSDRLPRPVRSTMKEAGHLANRRAAVNRRAHRLACVLRLPSPRHRRRRPGRAVGAVRRLPACSAISRKAVRRSISRHPNVTAIPPGAPPGTSLPLTPARQHGARRHGKPAHGRQAEFTTGTGAWPASAGGCALLARLLHDRYYGRRLPSQPAASNTARFLERLDRARLGFTICWRLATALTAAAGRRRPAPLGLPNFPVHELIVSGGGAHNPRIMAYLAAFLDGVRVTTSAEFAITWTPKRPSLSPCWRIKPGAKAGQPSFGHGRPPSGGAGQNYSSLKVWQSRNMRAIVIASLFALGLAGNLPAQVRPPLFFPRGLEGTAAGPPPVTQEHVRASGPDVVVARSG